MMKKQWNTDNFLAPFIIRQKCVGHTNVEQIFAGQSFADWNLFAINRLRVAINSLSIKIPNYVKNIHFDEINSLHVASHRVLPAITQRTDAPASSVSHIFFVFFFLRVKVIM